MLDLLRPDHAYLFGLLQADAHHSENTRNRGKIQLELASRDREILHRLQGVIPVNTTLRSRVRDTNFAKDFSCDSLTIFDHAFRQEMIALGLPVGKKSDVVAPPIVPYDKVNYWRGILDGDGSLGITGKGFPYLSLVTSSEAIKEAYIEFLSGYTGKQKCVHRNARDDVYNIVLYKEDAQLLIGTLYYDDCLALARKEECARQALEWTRPEGMALRPRGLVSNN